MRIAIMMSRLPRLIDPRAAWLRGLRAALRRAVDRGDTLLIVDGTAGSEFVRRGAERLGIAIETIDDSAASPLSELNSDGRDRPLAEPDRRLVEAADAVIVLGVRANGNLHRLLRERLAARRAVELVELLDLQPSAVRGELCEQGAAALLPSSGEQRPLVGTLMAQGVDGSCVRQREDAFVYELVPFPSRETWACLSHTTRACPGPWPQQTQRDYLDSLLEDRPDADHSAVAALSRIVGERRLIASGRVIRGGQRVVCFTEVPLLDLPSLHCFRTHRGRWDFEPFGLCIRRDWLRQRGARPVVYGDEAAWDSLDESQRPYFQLARSAAKNATSSRLEIDWTVEREWRYEGDLNLSDLSPNDALAFVPNFEAARHLSAVSPWPITLWPDPDVETLSL